MVFVGLGSYWEENMEEVKEANPRLCKGPCQQIKMRILAGKYPNGNKKWVDENGVLWSGNICGDCNRLRLKEIMREKRKKNEKS